MPEFDGQAETGPDDMRDLASFIAENDPPKTARDDADPGKEPRRARDNSKPAATEDRPGEDAEEEEPDEEGDDTPAEEEEAPDDDKPADQPSGLKFKVPVKGDDGAETTEEVDEKELISGYQRHRDYTQKTQALAEREREAVGLFTQKLTEGRDYFLQQGEMALRAVHAMAGLKTDAEMATLAQTDQAAWVQEVQRANSVRGLMDAIRQRMDTERQQGKQQDETMQRERFAKAWDVLSKEGLDQPKLQSIFEGVHKTYGVPRERFATLSDPALVLIMRDAMAHRQLKSKQPTVIDKAQNAPRLPASRQAPSAKEARNAKLEGRFRTNKGASIKDLGAWIANNG